MLIKRNTAPKWAVLVRIKYILFQNLQKHLKRNQNEKDINHKPPRPIFQLYKRASC